MNKTDNYIFAFATFGHPNDFRQTPFLGRNAEIAKNIKVFDLSNAIKIFPDSIVYSLRKETVGTNQLIAYSIYTFAQEQASKRDGTFIGSSIVLANQLSEENLIINSLNEFHRNLVENNLKNGILKVNHSKDFIAGKKLKDFDKINNLNREIQNVNFNNTGKSLVVFCNTNPDKLIFFLKNGLDLLNIYDTIYFTKDEEVVKYVAQKGLFKYIQNVGDKKEFENEIQLLANKRKQEIESYLQELEKSKNDLENDRKSFEEKFRKQIEQNERKQKENDKLIQESKSELNQINDKYYQFSKEIDRLISKLKQNEKLDVVKNLFSENKSNFIRSIKEKKELQLISSVSNPQATTGLRGSVPSNPYGHNYQNGNEQDYRDEKKEYKLDIFKVLTFIFGLLITGLLTYFFVFYKEKNQAIEPITNVNETIIETDTLSHISKLNPAPNSEVGKEDLKKIHEKLAKDSKLNDVVDFVFKDNTSSISNIYKYQKSDYKKLLFDKNHNSFKIDNQDTIYVDSLKIVPNYTK